MPHHRHHHQHHHLQTDSTNHHGHQPWHQNGRHHHQSSGNDEKNGRKNDFVKQSNQSRVTFDAHLPVPKLSFVSASILVGILALVCYLNSCYGDFVFDDAEAVVGNKDLLPETPISNLFWNDFWGMPITRKESHKSYRPLTVLTFK